MDYFVLADCNNFYASCERVFNPKLENRAIIVLSNNDGCVIARSNEAKALGIKMGEPYFQVKDLCEIHQVAIFSSNFALYGDLSRRVMEVLASEAEEMEIYSIDEAFLKFDHVTSLKKLEKHCLKVRQKILQWVGIPVSFGIAETKTIAKLANELAKKNSNQPVFTLSKSDLISADYAHLCVKDVWGIGSGLQKRLAKFSVKYIQDFLKLDHTFVKKLMGVVGERIFWELKGVSCLKILPATPKKSIASSRSFGRNVADIDSLIEAAATFTAKAAVKLRAQNSVAGAILVYLDYKVDAALSCNKYLRQKFKIEQSFSTPTDNSGKMVATASSLVRQIYVPGINYKKCGIVLLNITAKANTQFDLFETSHNFSATEKSLTKAIDTINQQYGKNKIFYGATGISPNWLAKKERSSNFSLQNLNNLPQVF